MGLRVGLRVGLWVAGAGGPTTKREHAVALHVSVLTTPPTAALETPPRIANVKQVPKSATTITTVVLPLLRALRRRRLTLGVVGVGAAVVVPTLPPGGTTRRGKMLRLQLHGLPRLVLLHLLQRLVLLRSHHRQ